MSGNISVDWHRQKKRGGQLADLGHSHADGELAKLPKDACIKVHVVHDPVIGGTDKDIPAAAELLHTTLARHYWDPTGDFGRQMSQVLGLLHGSRPVYAWDVWMIYPPDAVWSAKDPPQPAFLCPHAISPVDDDPMLIQRMRNLTVASQKRHMHTVTQFREPVPVQESAAGGKPWEGDAANERGHGKSATEDNVDSRQYQLELTTRDFSDSFDELTLIKGNYQRHVRNRVLR